MAEGRWQMADAVMDRSREVHVPEVRAWGCEVRDGEIRHWLRRGKVAR